MKAFITVLIVALITNLGFSQGIKYENTFDEALAKASVQNKLVFVVVNGPKSPSVIIFTSGLSQPEVAEKYNKAFINYQLSVTDTAWGSIRKKYNSLIFPAYFFIDKYNNLVYRDTKNSTLARRYIVMADSAIGLSQSGKSLTAYNLKYATGNLDAQFLKEYIILRQKMGIDDNAKLIEEYVIHSPIKLVDNYNDVLFILKAGPIVYGRAYSLAYTNPKLVDSIYKREPSADRSAMNGKMITNSYKKAVEEKNDVLMEQLSAFLINTHRSNARAGQKESARYLTYYYQAVKDTANYLRQATFLYDNFYMDISADSAKTLIDKQRESLMKTIKGRSISADSLKKLASKNPNTTKSTQSFTVVSVQQDIANVLNNAAYSFYLSGTHNTTYISKAITWSKRAIELRPASGYYDTLAHLLYRYGSFIEAEANENTAIDMAQKNNRQPELDRLKAELVKMKQHSL